MIRESSPYIAPLTHGMAREFATMKSWQGERPLSRKRVDKLRRIYEANDFTSPSWSFAWFRGEKVRMNGQHSSTMLAECSDIPAGMKAIISEYHVDSEEDLAKLFCRFDAAWSVRNATAVTSALTTELGDITLRDRRSIASGMYSEIEGFPSKSGEPDARASAIHADHDFARWAFATIRGAHMQKVGVYAASFRTWKRDRNASKEFWSLVSSESDPDTGNATRALARYLRDYKRRDGGQSDIVRTAAICVTAWNSWRAGRTVKILKYVGNGVPVAL